MTGTGSSQAPFSSPLTTRAGIEDSNVNIDDEISRIIGFDNGDGTFTIPYNSLSRNEQDNIVNVTREYPFDYATVMFGYIMPFVLVITLFTNTLVVMVLAQRHMRTPTNIVLFTMAIVDLMTLLWPSPWYFYIYTLGYHDRFLHPPSACYAHHIMTDVIPVFFHTSSIWLALLLASQRYIYVCHPTLASTWCTVPRVRRAIFIILLIALLHQITRFFDNTYESISIEYEERTHLACKNGISQWVLDLDVGLYFSTYYTFRILFVFIIPCVALITLNCLLFRALKRAKNKRTELMMKECNVNNNLTRTARRSCECTSGAALMSQCRTETTALCNSTNEPVAGATKHPEDRAGHHHEGFCKRMRRKRKENAKKATRSGSMAETTGAGNQPNAGLVVSTSINDLSTTEESHIQEARQQTEPENIALTSFTGGRPEAEASSTVSALPQTAPTTTTTTSQFLALPAHPHPMTSSSSASLRNLDSNRTTLMLIVVVTVFLMVEVPVAIVTIAHVILNSFDIFQDVEFGGLNYIKLFTNFIIMISYSVNFTIYCSMSKKFRETFKDLFLFGERARKRRAQQQHQLHQQQHQTTRGEQETGLHSGRTRNGQPMIIFM